ncbi:Methyltransferase trt5 [Metarhizium anisopliae]
MDEAKLKTAMETDPEKAKAYWKEHVYVEELPDNIKPFKELLQEYSKMSPAEVDSLLHRTRAQLWEVVKYPCIGRWAFTNLRSIEGPRLEAATRRLLSTGTNNDAILDVGCCIGQALRYLAHKGLHPSRLYGTDLHPEFMQIGNELFGDKDRGPTFVAGDMLDTDDVRLRELDHKVTMIHAGNFFHLFTWDQQVKIGTRMLRFFQPGTTDAVIFGRHIGTLRPREIDDLGVYYLHNQESFEKLWGEIGDRTGTKWRVEAEVVERLGASLPFFGDDERYMTFGVYQIFPSHMP